MATLSDISKKVNVSPAAISRILNRDPEFVASKAVRLAVMKAAVELGYKTPRQKKKSDNTIEVAIADWHSVPASRRSEFDYSTLIPLTDSKVDYVFSRLEKGSPRLVDAIIGVGIFSQEEIDEMMFSSTNIVFLNNFDDNIPFDKMLIDYDTTVGKSIDYLIDRGCRRIGFISGVSEENGITIGRRRIEAVKDILREKGVLDDSLIEIGGLTDESGYHMAEELMKKNPDAVVLGTQLVEKGVLEYINTLPSPPLIILRRDIDLGHEKTDHPCVRMSSEQLWRITLLLTYMKCREPAPPLKVIIEAEFDTSNQ